MRSSRGSSARSAHIASAYTNIACAASAAPRAVRVGVEPEGELGPLEHLLAVLLGHADEVGDRVQRQPHRDVAHEVALAAVGDRVDHRVDPCLHVRGEVVDATGREAGADELAQLRVLGRVEADHQQRRAASSPKSARVGQERIRRVPEPGPVARDALHVGVARHRPVAALPTPDGRGARPGRCRGARGTRRTGSRARRWRGRAAQGRRRRVCSCLLGYRRPGVRASPRAGDQPVANSSASLGGQQLRRPAVVAVVVRG